METGHPPIHAPRPRTIKQRQGLDFGRDYKKSPQFDSLIEKWDDFEVPESPPPVPAQFLTDSDSGSSETIVTPTRTSSKEHLQDAKPFDYKQAMVAYISTGHLPTPESPKRQQTSRTPPPNNLLSAPITIIVTSPSPTPDQERRPAGQTHQRRDGEMMSRNIRKSLLSPNPHHLNTFKSHLNLDTTRLMPPPEHQIDVRKLRKVDEFQEIRSFLINFMNAKGDQFPKNLRTQMMELYGITQGDLAPSLTAKFEREQDEGVALDTLKETETHGEEPPKSHHNHAESLQILKHAFRSQMTEFAPRLERRAGDVAITRSRRTSSVNKTHPNPNPNPVRPLPVRVSTSPPRSTPTPASSTSTSKPPSKEKNPEEGDPMPTWLGPLISRSAADHPQHLLRSSHSAPDLSKRKVRPQGTTTQSSSSIPTIGNRNGNRHESLTDLKLKNTRVKRGVIAGAFGAVREALGGGKLRSREARS